MTERYAIQYIRKGEKEMTIKECYAVADADFADVIKRLGSEAMVKRFALKFPNDTSFEDLKEGIRLQDGEKAFRAAHTLKGVCLNLGFTGLGKASSELTEKLRGREISGSEELMQEVEAKYTSLVENLRQVE